MTVCVVTYGRSAYLGRFRAPTDLNVVRGAEVVVKTPRGLELGEVLDPHNRTPADWPMGDVSRLAQPQDRERAADLTRQAEHWLTHASDLVEQLSLPLSILDAEMPLDGEQLILHIVRWADTSADALCEQLESAAGIHVTLLDLSQPPTPVKASGCSSCGSGGGCSSCGSGGGGCSSGSCSRGSAQSAAELADYFAGLRSQMEASQRRTPLR